MTSEYADEFPLLASIGLYATPTSGEGNCLFHALSDQLYGIESRHAEIRARVVRHMAEHASYFQNFFSMPVRRAPKRKAAANRGGGGTRGRGRGGKNGAGGGEGDGDMASESALQKGFEAHLKQMAKLGTYGDNMEISAFAREYGVDVRVYQMEFTYVIGPGDFVGDGREERDYTVDAVYIAYHTWEHYSSIRNIAGPHTGHPQICPFISGKPIVPTPTTVTCKPWMLDMAKRSLTFHLPDRTIQAAIVAARGNVNAAVDKLLSLEEGLDSETDSPSFPGPHRSRSSTKSDSDSFRPSPTPPPVTPSRQKQLKSSRTSSPVPARNQTAGQVRKSRRIQAKEVAKVAGPISKKKKRELMRAAKNVSSSDGGGEDTGGDTDSGGVVSGIRELYV